MDLPRTHAYMIHLYIPSYKRAHFIGGLIMIFHIFDLLGELLSPSSRLWKWERVQKNTPDRDKLPDMGVRGEVRTTRSDARRSRYEPAPPKW